MGTDASPTLQLPSDDLIDDRHRENYSIVDPLHMLIIRFTTPITRRCMQIKYPVREIQRNRGYIIV